MTSKKQWSDLTKPQQTGIILSGIIQLGLLVAALWDIHHRPADTINGSKWLWTAVAFINFIGPISYFLFGRKR